MRVCTSELYLGAVTNRKQLNFFSCADLNAFDEDLVREWTKEVKNAALFYLTTSKQHTEAAESRYAKL